MNSTGTDRTPISKLGKFGLIERITKNAIPVNSSTVLGPGDDCSIIAPDKELTLVSTDLMLEGIHFNLIYTPLKHLGYKAVIRGISDIYAMNGIPQQILISLGLSSKFCVEQVDEIYDGIFMACEKYNVDVAGGDTTSSLTGLTIGITALGTTDKKHIIKRNGARQNDLICITGDLGASFMGLQLLERERRLFDKEKVTEPDLAGYEYIVGRQLKPEIPVAAIKELSDANVTISSMTDVTDGLASDLIHICKLSKTGCRIFYSKIPIDYETSKLAEVFNIDPMVPALNGGEDYEMLFTVPLSELEKLNLVKSVKVIGHMTSEKNRYYIAGDDGSEVEIKAQGWGQTD
jgi:thiamine-monophosphate kinase